MIQSVAIEGYTKQFTVFLREGVGKLQIRRRKMHAIAAHIDMPHNY